MVRGVFRVSKARVAEEEGSPRSPRPHQQGNPINEGPRESRKGMPLSAKMSTEPALVLIAAAPITIQSRGVRSSGSTSKKNR